MVPVMTNPQLLVEELEKLLSQWAKLGRRAQLEAVMPIVSELVEHRASYQNLADMMTSNGLDIGGHALRQALYRWRKRSGSGVISESLPKVLSPELATGVSGETAINGSQLIKSNPAFLSGGVVDEKGPLTKASLREIRDKHIDLDEISRQARKLRKQES